MYHSKQLPSFEFIITLSVLQLLYTTILSQIKQKSVFVNFNKAISKMAHLANYKNHKMNGSCTRKHISRGKSHDEWAETKRIRNWKGENRQKDISAECYINKEHDALDCSCDWKTFSDAYRCLDKIPVPPHCTGTTDAWTISPLVVLPLKNDSYLKGLQQLQ